jgi:hypothetical protein
MAVPPIKRGTRLNTTLVNRIIEQANRIDRFDAAEGQIVKVGSGGIQLSNAAKSALMEEPAHAVVVVNAGTVAIDAYAPAGVIESCATEDGELINQRALKVRVPKAEDAGAFVIAQDRIEPGGAGLAWCGGTCMVRLYRWFDSEMLERADIAAGERYALASLDGGLDVIWSQRDPVSSAPIVDREHFAVVRFNHQRFLRWYNSGTTSVALGSPIVPNVTDTDGLITGTLTGILNCRAPIAADVKTLAYVNVGGTVEAGQYGRCTVRESLVRTVASYAAGLTVGAATALTGMSSTGTGFNLLARLGAYQSVQYAIAKPAGGSSADYSLTIDCGQTLSDGSTLGIKWASPAPTTVPSLYDPTVTSSFIDGVGRAHPAHQRRVASGSSSSRTTPATAHRSRSRCGRARSCATSPATQALPLVRRLLAERRRSTSRSRRDHRPRQRSVGLRRHAQRPRPRRPAGAYRTRTSVPGRSVERWRKRRRSGRTPSPGRPTADAFGVAFPAGLVGVTEGDLAAEPVGGIDQRRIRIAVGRLPFAR